MDKLAELQVPNILGAEKEAISEIVAIAEKIGLSRDRIEDLKTALAEACINAIEHGNKFDENKKVRVTVSADDNTLQVIVHDEGDGIDPEKIPKRRVRDNGFPCRRGYGIFLIANLVNGMSFNSKPGKGNDVKMVMHLENKKQNQ